MDRRFRSLTLLSLTLLLVIGGAGAPLQLCAQSPRDIELRVDISGIDGALLTNAEALVGIVRASRSGNVRPGHVYRLYERAPEQFERALEPFGFYRVTVTSSLQSETRPWSASFDVDPGPPMLVDRLDIRIVGEAEQDSAFQAALDQIPLAEGDTLNHPAYENARADIELLASDRGYLDAVWDSAFIRVDLEEYRAEIVLHMTTGPRFRFGEVTIDQEWIDMDILEPHMGFEVGDPFHSSEPRISRTSRSCHGEIWPTTAFASRSRSTPGPGRRSATRSGSGTAPTPVRASGSRPSSGD